jgi:hypothetical protein
MDCAALAAMLSCARRHAGKTGAERLQSRDHAHTRWQVRSRRTNEMERSETMTWVS